MAGFHVKGESAYFDQKRVQTSGKSGVVEHRPAQPPICPECRSSRTWKDGLRHNEIGVIQRRVCRDCGYRFSDPSLSNKKTKRHTLEYQVCAEAKNLVTVETREKQVAGATKTSDATVKGKIVDFAWWMRKEGYRPSTIRSYPQRIKRLTRIGADILDPENVKAVMAKQSWGEGYKNAIAIAYTAFLTMLGRKWNRPRYKTPESLPFIPLESEIDALINSCGRKMACFLQGLKDTGADPGELARIEWTDVNYKAKSVTIRHPVKRHNPRVVPVSDAFLRRLSTMPKNRERIFATVKGLESNYANQRRRYARILGNLRLMKIEFRTLRHWKGTMEYHKTRDPYHVKKILGHKHLLSTEIYINLEQAVFDSSEEEFHAKVAETLEEATSLMEAGFEYVGKIHGAEMFRKRK
ncbi:MAG: tyrosine-type recombinase/integrase [Candidatus Bathyarchaeota archaeon]|nr:tyrosine-type recombinase/integrase [Candidatus Bathyarchaeota archaeon]